MCDNHGQGDSESEEKTPPQSTAAAVTKKAVLECYRSKHKHKDGFSLLPPEFDRLVEEYIDTYFDTHVHVVTGSTLENWLLPSFLPLPTLLSLWGPGSLGSSCSSSTAASTATRRA
jgi:hypothetical protein